MKTYVINLKSRPDRLRQLEKANIPFEWERFEATSSNDFFIGAHEDKEVEGKKIRHIKATPPLANKRMRAHAACQQSHMRLLHKIYTENTDEYTLVLEDDVEFDDKQDAWMIVDTTIGASMLAGNYVDILYLGGDKRKVEESMGLVERALEIYQTHAYIIKRSFIPTLLEELEKGYGKVDVIFSKVLPKGNCFILKNPIAFQSKSKSDIDTR